MNCLCARTRRLSRLLNRRYEEELQAAGLTPAQFELLANISARAGVSQSELAKALSIDQTTLSRNMNVLIDRRWIGAAVAREDSRRTMYSTTAKGRNVLQEALPRWERAQQEVERELGSSLETVWEALDRLTAVLEGIDIGR